MSIMTSLNWNEEEVNEILADFGFISEEGAKEKLNFEEFIALMQSLEKKILIQEREMREE
jgi:hypothetical protein